MPLPRLPAGPSVCQIHHLIPWAKGGPTTLGNLALFCRYHHIIVIHRWGWAITCHPNGTTTATSPDGRTLHSHGPPTAARKRAPGLSSWSVSVLLSLGACHRHPRWAARAR
jgi:HNH endonuclease